MSFTGFAVTVWAVLALGWLGFLIIVGGLLRDVVTALAARKSSDRTPRDKSPKGRGSR